MPNESPETAADTKKSPRDHVRFSLARIGRSLATLSNHELRPAARREILRASMNLSDIEANHYSDGPPIPSPEEEEAF